MKKMMKKFVAYGLVSLSVLTCSTFAAAEDKDTNVGDYASTVSSPTHLIPNGHFSLIATYADDTLSANNGTGGHRSVTAASLMDANNDANKIDDITDYYLLDIRSPASYKAGHIAGAINVQFGDVANPGVLAALPTDKPILIICNTGHTASFSNGILATLGYDAWTLKFGMTSWTGVYPVVTGENQ